MTLTNPKHLQGNSIDAFFGINQAPFGLFPGFIYADHAEWDYATKRGFCKVCNEEFQKDPRYQVTEFWKRRAKIFCWCLVPSEREN